MGNVEVAWEDVISVINMMRAHLIIIAAALIAMIVVIIAVRKMERSKRRLFRVQSVLAFFTGYCDHVKYCSDRNLV